MSPGGVVALADVDEQPVRLLLGRYGMILRPVAPHAPIPGSWWGEREAGLRGAALHARPDTPLHSVLHEACHFVCMSPARRDALDTDAGGDYYEENAVCYLQVLLADEIPRFGRARMLADMDAWGYSFRLGSARAWFESDAADAREWLLERTLIDAAERPSFSLRSA